jgi:hypothetical protein
VGAFEFRFKDGKFSVIVATVDIVNGDQTDVSGFES